MLGVPHAWFWLPLLSYDGPRLGHEEGFAADKWDYTATDQLRDMAAAGTEEVPQLKMAEDTRQNM